MEEGGRGAVLHATRDIVDGGQMRSGENLHNGLGDKPLPLRNRRELHRCIKLAMQDKHIAFAFGEGLATFISMNTVC